MSDGDVNVVNVDVDEHFWGPTGVVCRSVLILWGDEESGNVVMSEPGFGCGWWKVEGGCGCGKVREKVELVVRVAVTDALGPCRLQPVDFLGKSFSSG